MQAFHLGHEPEEFMAWSETGDRSLAMGWNPIDCRSKGVAPTTLIVPWPRRSNVLWIRSSCSGRTSRRSSSVLPIAPGMFRGFVANRSRDGCHADGEQLFVRPAAAIEVDAAPTYAKGRTLCLDSHPNLRVTKQLRLRVSEARVISYDQY
jgi:hypothetical protein